MTAVFILMGKKKKVKKGLLCVETNQFKFQEGRRKGFHSEKLNADDRMINKI